MTGAYVQAWVFISHVAEDETDERIRERARAQYGRDGEIEIDDNAEISISENPEKE